MGDDLKRVKRHELGPRPGGTTRAIAAHLAWAWFVAVAVMVSGCSDSPPMAPSQPTIPTSPAPAPGPAVQGRLVTRVVDGDTIVVEGVGTVRLIGVDTPETVDPDSPVEYYGKEASDFTRRVADRQIVTLEFDQDRVDRYGRTLAYVYLPDGTLLNAEIIRLGYGFAYTFFPFRLIEEFRALEREARAAGRGLWAPRGSARATRQRDPAAAAADVPLSGRSTASRRTA